MPESLESKISNIETMPRPENSPERISNPENKAETNKVAESEQTQVSEVAMPQNTNSPAVSNSDNMILEKVEGILSENMEKVFLSMDVSMQARFKTKGEETAQKISKLMGKSKIKTKEVLTLILEWLRIIPKVNKHFIEQEAKIKTDNILKLHKQK